jgi:hypothetical protein
MKPKHKIGDVVYMKPDIISSEEMIGTIIRIQADLDWGTSYTVEWHCNGKEFFFPYPSFSIDRMKKNYEEYRETLNEI